MIFLYQRKSTAFAGKTVLMNKFITFRLGFGRHSLFLSNLSLDVQDKDSDFVDH